MAKLILLMYYMIKFEYIRKTRIYTGAIPEGMNANKL